jgi:NADH:ubiquinone oxidoreductase subunit E
MLTVSICVGQSCHEKGSAEIVSVFEEEIRQRGLEGSVTLTGMHCSDPCFLSTTVRVGERVFRGLSPQDARDFFLNEILPRIQEEDSGKRPD